MMKLLVEDRRQREKEIADDRRKREEQFAEERRFQDLEVELELHRTAVSHPAGFDTLMCGCRPWIRRVPVRV